MFTVGVYVLELLVEHLRLGQYSCRLAPALTTVTKTTVNTHLGYDEVTEPPRAKEGKKVQYWSQVSATT